MEIKQQISTIDTCKINDDYTNPNNLNYYLIGNSVENLNVQIIKQKFIATSIGNIEIAIIGSSHYIRLDNVFTELLTCTNEQIKKDELIITNSGSYMRHVHKFGKLNYQTSIHSVKKASKSDFITEEQAIYSQENDLKHYFYNNTALTALKLQSKGDSKYTIDTWHSYPEYLSIVYSTTELFLEGEVEN